MTEQAYQIPILLYIICALSSMSFVICANEWLWRAYKTPERPTLAFNAAIIRGQISVFFFALVLSLFIGLYDAFMIDKPLRITGELIILGGLYSYMFFANRQNFKNWALSFTKHFTLLGLGCVLGWAITITIGYVLYFIFTHISVMTTNDLFLIVVFISGLLWNAPILVLHRKILLCPTRRPNLAGKNFYDFLWPVLFAYLILLIPLMTQEMVNSEEWQDRAREKPTRQVHLEYNPNAIV